MTVLDAQRFGMAVDYHRLRLSSANDTIVKRALQDLCELLRSRSAAALSLQKRAEIELPLLGLLQTKARDPKIIMWTLNALAFVGEGLKCTEAVLNALKFHEENAAVLASGISALQKIDRNFNLDGLASLASKSVMVLASLRHTPPSKVDIRSARIDIEVSDAELLKLALILVGTRKAPAQLFHPEHDNPEIVRVLGSHDDAVVRQYSCWACAENPDLGFAKLGIPFHSIESQPANVRAWMYETLCKDGPKDSQSIEYIENGSRDPEVRAQAGLSHGLRNFYVDGLEPIIIDWYCACGSEEVRQNLQYHFAAFANKASTYGDAALAAFTDARRGSEVRANLLAAASGTPLYAEMTKVELSGDPTLFALPELIGIGPGNVTNNNFNFNGDAKIGVLSGSGNASNSGQISIDSIEDYRKALSDFLTSLEGSELPASKKKALKKLAEDAQKRPERSTWSSLVDFLNQMNDTVVKGVSSGEAWAKVAVALSHLALFL